MPLRSDDREQPARHFDTERGSDPEPQTMRERASGWWCLGGQNESEPRNQRHPVLRRVLRRLPAPERGGGAAGSIRATRQPSRRRWDPAGSSQYEEKDRASGQGSPHAAFSLKTVSWGIPQFVFSLFFLSLTLLPVTLPPPSLFPSLCFL